MIIVTSCLTAELFNTDCSLPHRGFGLTDKDISNLVIESCFKPPYSHKKRMKDFKILPIIVNRSFFLSNIKSGTVVMYLEASVLKKIE